MKRLVFLVTAIALVSFTEVDVFSEENNSLKILFEKATSGDADAQCRLGGLYSFGNGVPKNDVESVRWYRMAAEQGNADAQLFLGWCYTCGKGVQKDEAEAAKWFLGAAEARRREISESTR